MPILIVRNTIADPLLRKATEKAVRSGVTNRDTDYEVRVVADAKGDAVSIAVTGPDGGLEHTFCGLMKDPCAIYIYFRYAIPQNRPEELHPICDECVRTCGYVVMGLEEQHDGYVCIHHRRYWHRLRGYYYAHVSQSCTHRCEECENVMYVEFADSMERVVLRCPSCLGWKRASLS